MYNDKYYTAKQTVEEAARDFAEKQYPCVKGWYYVKSIDAFKAGAEWQAKQLGWISVKERLPEYNKRVIVLHKNRHIDTSIYHEDNNWSMFDRDIIAWIPIPSFDQILEANKDVLQRMKGKGD